MAPKDRDSKLQKSVLVYRYKCPHINCPQEYIGESGRAFGDRYKEHLKAPSPHQHHRTSSQLRLLYHHTQGGTNQPQKHQGGYVYQDQ